MNCVIEDVLPIYERESALEVVSRRSIGLLPAPPLCFQFRY